MAKEKYIKVTPKGDDKSYIVLEANKLFYLSQGAKVEPVADEETGNAEPEEYKPVKQRQPRTRKTNSK